jgi:hypothetical protein
VHPLEVVGSFPNWAASEGTLIPIDSKIDFLITNANAYNLPLSFPVVVETEAGNRVSGTATITP